jgi:hypothetical protein
MASLWILEEGAEVVALAPKLVREIGPAILYWRASLILLIFFQAGPGAGGRDGALEPVDGFRRPFSLRGRRSGRREVGALCGTVLLKDTRSSGAELAGSDTPPGVW